MFYSSAKSEKRSYKVTSVKERLPVKSERAFRVLVKTAFNQRRKTMRNAVKSLFTQEILQNELFARRAETLSVKEFADLTFKMI